MIEFVSFTNQRNKEYQLATEIISRDGSKSVRKLPLTEAASAHIRRMKQTLRTHFDSEHFEYVEYEETDKGIEFAFAQGSSVETYLNGLLDAGQVDRFTSYVGNFFRLYKSDYEDTFIDFAVSDSFAEWFGSPDLTGNMTGVPFANIDITFDNVFMRENDHFTVIDPEWLFDFVMPYEYPVYRTIRRYYINSVEGKYDGLLTFDDLINLSGIDRNSIPVFRAMDDFFNKKIFACNMPPLGHIHSVIDLVNKNSFASQVYLTDPPREDVSIVYNIDSTEQKIRIDVAASPAGTIRFDPIMSTGVVYIKSCVGVTADHAVLNLSYHSNAAVTNGDILLFTHDDPSVYLEMPETTIDTIELCFQVLMTGLAETAVLSDRIGTALTQLKDTGTALEIQLQKYRSLEDYLNSFLTHMTELEAENAKIKLEQEALQIKYNNRTIKGAFRRMGRVSKRVLRACAKKMGLSRNSLIVQVIRHPSKIRKALSIIKHTGFAGLSRKIAGTRGRAAVSTNGKVDKKLLEQMKTVISIIMPVYNVDVKWLDLAVKSVMKQTYANWQLCIADDASTNEDTKKYLTSLTDKRISVIFLENNAGIAGASNEAAALCTGEYIALMDNDDELHPNALYELAKSIAKTSADILYTDEDKVDMEGRHRFPFYKPDWSPDLLNAQMYIGHIFCFRRNLFEEVGGFDPEYNGSQDYDLAFRLTERSKQIVHIPKVLYSWREIPTSTAANPSAKPYSHVAGLLAVDSHLKRKYGSLAFAEETENYFVYNPQYAVDEKTTKISIIIPMKDKVDLTRKCIFSIFSKTLYKNFEIILVNNQSQEPATYEWFTDIKEKYSFIKVVNADCEFNWSKINNLGVRQSVGSVLVFLNNDTEVISPDWLETLAGNALRPDVGTVGPMLLYEDGTIQHAGIVIGIGGWADHIFKGQKPVHFGSPFVSPVVIRNVSANTGACLAISRSKFYELGEFDERFIICGSDVELSIRATDSGYFNVFLPSIRLYHLESKSRDSYIPENDYELSYQSYTPYRQNGDPFYNNNLSYESADVKQVKRPGDKQGVR